MSVHRMKTPLQANVMTLVAALVVSSCTPPSDPEIDRESREVSPPAVTSEPPTDTPATSGEAVTSSGGSERIGVATADSASQVSEVALPEKDREELHAGARKLVEEFVDAFSRGDTARARSKFISKKAFEEIVVPGFRSILGSGLLAKNEEELANLIAALKGHKVDRWEWKPGKLRRTKPESAFARSLVQLSGGRIELEVDGTFVVVGLDQLLQVDGGWVIFQMHNL